MALPKAKPRSAIGSVRSMIALGICRCSPRCSRTNSRRSYGAGRTESASLSWPGGGCPHRRSSAGLSPTLQRQESALAGIAWQEPPLHSACDIVLRIRGRETAQDASCRARYSVPEVPAVCAVVGFADLRAPLGPGASPQAAEPTAVHCDISTPPPATRRRQRTTTIQRNHGTDDLGAVVRP
jgi:hypothetical protein